MIYYGYPCTHYFAVLIHKEEDLIEGVRLVLQQRWKLSPRASSSFPLEKKSFFKMQIFQTPQQKGWKKKVDKINQNQNKQQNQLSTQSQSSKKSNGNFVNSIFNIKLGQVQNNRPSPPKKPMNSDSIYAQENREEFKIKYPNLKHSDISKELAKAFKNLDSNEKSRYELKAKRLSEEYIKEKEKYEEKYGKVEKKGLFLKLKKIQQIKGKDDLY